jgi:hypothetical protein
MFNDPAVLARALQQEGLSLARKFAPKGMRQAEAGGPGAHHSVVEGQKGQVLCAPSFAFPCVGLGAYCRAWVHHSVASALLCLNSRSHK